MTPPDIPRRYLLPDSRPNWVELLADWKAGIPPGASPWLLTKFGDVFFCQAEGKIGMLQVSGFRYQVVANDKIDFLEWLVDPDKMADWFLAPLVDSLEIVGRHLESEQCYSFIKPPGLGGDLTVANVMAIPIREHFGLWGEVFRQIKDLPDGGQIVLKVT